MTCVGLFNSQAHTAASHDLVIELRVRASIKALVNAYFNIYMSNRFLSSGFFFGQCKDIQNPLLFVRFLEKKNGYDAKK